MGEKILAGEIAEKYGISKTPVTQSIKLLCNDDIFQILPTGRIIVPTLTRKDVEDVCSVRYMLEGYCADIICTRDPFLNRNLVAEMKALAKSCAEMDKEHKHVEFVKTDMKLHQTFVAGAGNQYLQKLFQKVHGRYMVACYLMISLESRDFQHSINEHNDLVTSIEDRDAEQAKRILKSHITYILNFIK